MSKWWPKVCLQSCLENHTFSVKAWAGEARLLACIWDLHAHRMGVCTFSWRSHGDNGSRGQMSSHRLRGQVTSQWATCHLHTVQSETSTVAHRGCTVRDTETRDGLEREVANFCLFRGVQKEYLFACNPMKKSLSYIDLIGTVCWNNMTML